MPHAPSTRGSSQPVVRCVGITKYFGGVRALDHVSLELNSGEIVGLVGDNGAGKSTLVKILSGIYPPDEGSIWLENREVRHLNPKEAREFSLRSLSRSGRRDELASADDRDRRERTCYLSLIVHGGLFD
jgi:ABC-type branched-subunit amino acid transport system ATPase component